jgi:hypothetical protein
LHVLLVSISDHFPAFRASPTSITSRAMKRATAAGFGWQWQHFTQEDERYAEQFLGWIAPCDAGLFPRQDSSSKVVAVKGRPHANSPRAGAHAT